MKIIIEDDDGDILRKLKIYDSYGNRIKLLMEGFS